MDNLMCTPSNQANVVQQQQQPQQQETAPFTTTNKKLYFKQSATEALHSAILLKARNPAASPQLKPNDSSNNTNNNKILLLNPKLTNQTNLISISPTSNLASQLQASSSASPSLNDDSSFSSCSPQSADVLVLQTNTTTNNYSDELDSPLKIKENILTSIRNLKPVLAGLSSSTSDDDDDINIISDTTSLNAEQNQSEVILIGSTQTLPNVNLTTSNNNINNSNGVVKLTIPTSTVVTAPPPLNTNSMQRHSYLRTNTCYAKLNTTTTMTTSTPKLPSALNETKLACLTTTTTSSNQSTTVTPPIIFNKSPASSSLASSLLLAKPQLGKLSVRSKRGKEEALSNSSSSDEEAEQQQQQQQYQQQTAVLQQRNGNQKLQLILNNTNTLKSLITTTSTSKQNLLTVNSQSTWSNTKLIEQPQITPVVSASAAAAAAAASSSSSLSSTNIFTNSVSSSYANSDSDLINSPSSMSSNKSDSDYGSMVGTNLSFSISSPTSCCSSSNSSSCTTNDSSSAIDLNDDTSSTASGPIYVRQPGFEFHAHEVQLPQEVVVSQSSEQQKSAKSLTRGTKKATESSKQVSSTKATTKAKKKLCMMMNTELSPITTRDAESVLKQSVANANIHLKPISNKAKREPLPMRLRALPPSFWQQPNQPNPSISTMYLPPLFKNEIIDSSILDDTDANLVSIDDTNTIKLFDSPGQNYGREVRISPANTDLLFKLFDNIEQKQDTKKQLQLQMQLKSNRLNSKAAAAANVKAGLSKALIKGEDPCIVDAVTEGLFPLLRLDSRTDTTAQYHLPFGANGKSDCLLSNLNSNGLSSSSPVLCSNTSAATSVMINSNLISANNVNLLPSIQFEQNYSQALSEVVAAL